jgi:methionine sulfoxide reductase catalytic subunit
MLPEPTAGGIKTRNARFGTPQAMVFTTGLLVNLNHIYPGRNDYHWLGLLLFLASMVVVVAGWAVATPLTLRHPRIVQRAGQAIVGPLQHLFEHLDPKPGQYGEADISPYFWHNGQYPDSEEYKALFGGRFADYRLRINGLVDNPVELDLVQLRALPHHEQITQHVCIQGWSGIAKWGAASRCGRSPTSLSHNPRRNGSCSTPSAKEPTKASTTTPTRSST